MKTNRSGNSIERLSSIKQTLDSKLILADLSLFFVAVFWGSNFLIMKLALEEIASFTYLAKLSGALLIFAGILLTELRSVFAARLAVKDAGPVKGTIISEDSVEGEQAAGVE